MRTIDIARAALLVAIAACSDSTHDTVVGPVGVGILEPTVAPASATVHVGEVQQYTVKAGSAYPIWLWRVSDTTVATVDSTGLVHTRKNGTITVIASAAAAPTILAAGQLTVVP